MYFSLIDKIDELKQEILEDVEGTVEDAKEQFGAVTSEISDAVEGAIDVVEEGAAELKDELNNITDAALTGIDAAAEEFAEIAAGDAEAAKEAVPAINAELIGKLHLCESFFFSQRSNKRSCFDLIHDPMPPFRE